MAVDDQTTGGCYCGKVRYAFAGTPSIQAQCHCRPCQYIAGGGPNYFMLMPVENFLYTQGAPAQFSRPDLGKPVTREFCANCGTHLVTRLPDNARIVVKVGTLDQPDYFKGPQLAIHCLEKPGFHMIPDGIPAYDHLPQAD